MALKLFSLKCCRFMGDKIYLNSFKKNYDHKIILFYVEKSYCGGIMKNQVVEFLKSYFRHAAYNTINMASKKERDQRQMVKQGERKGKKIESNNLATLL